MLVPAKRSNNLFDDFMMTPFDAFFDIPTGSGSKTAPGLMRTDIKESDSAFDLEIDLPGVKKEDVSVEIENGYLEVTAESKHESEEKDDSRSYVRKERFSGKFSRRFYMGDDIDEDAITAKFEDGTLKVNIPKRSEPEPESKKSIAIV